MGTDAGLSGQPSIGMTSPSAGKAFIATHSHSFFSGCQMSSRPPRAAFLSQVAPSIFQAVQISGRVLVLAFATRSYGLEHRSLISVEPCNDSQGLPKMPTVGHCRQPGEPPRPCGRPPLSQLTLVEAARPSAGLFRPPLLGYPPPPPHTAASCSKRETGYDSHTNHRFACTQLRWPSCDTFFVARSDPQIPRALQ